MQEALGRLCYAAKNQLFAVVTADVGIGKSTLIRKLRDTLEEIRFMLNCRMDSMNPMALILVGQNELWDKLVKSVYAAIRQRIDLKCVLPPLDLAQVTEYMQAHLRYADGQQDIFTEQAIAEIHNYSAGSSRAVNKLCTHYLLSAAQRARNSSTTIWSARSLKPSSHDSPKVGISHTTRCQFSDHHKAKAESRFRQKVSANRGQKQRAATIQDRGAKNLQPHTVYPHCSMRDVIAAVYTFRLSWRR